jgi:hypothetical protein
VHKYIWKFITWYIYNYLQGLYQVQKRRKEKRKVWRKRKEKRRWKKSITLMVAKVNIKFRFNVRGSWSENWRDYIRLWSNSIPKFKRKQICFVGVMEFWRFWPKGGFLIILPSFEPFWIYRCECLYIIRKYTHGENFKWFVCVLREIWGFGISTLV